MREISDVYFMYAERFFSLTDLEAWSSKNDVICTVLVNIVKILSLLG